MVGGPGSKSSQLKLGLKKSGVEMSYKSQTNAIRTFQPKGSNPDFSTPEGKKFMVKKIMVQAVMAEKITVQEFTNESSGVEKVWG